MMSWLEKYCFWMKHSRELQIPTLRNSAWFLILTLLLPNFGLCSNHLINKTTISSPIIIKITLLLIPSNSVVYHAKHNSAWQRLSQVSRYMSNKWIHVSGNCLLLSPTWRRHLVLHVEDDNGAGLKVWINSTDFKALWWVITQRMPACLLVVTTEVQQTLDTD